MTAIQPSSDVFLSIRTSCNRCRIQKLKCIVSEPPNSTACCQRCARALVPCIFGRRERKRRGAPSVDAPRTSWPPSTQDIPTVLTHTLSPGTPGADMGGSELMLRRVTEDLSLPEHYTTSADHPTRGERSTCMHQMDTMFFGHTYQNDTMFGDEELFGYFDPYGIEQGEHMHGTHHEGTSQLTINDWNPSFEYSESFAESSTIYKSKAGSTALLQFAADLHARLDALEKEPSWRRESASMNDYPIGSILQLSVKLRTLGTNLQVDDSSDDSTNDDRSRHTSSTTSSANGNHLTITKPALPEDLDIINTTWNPRFDTSVSLILLSCYVTLLQISTVVVGHFQEYLAQSNAESRAPSMVASHAFVVCLGDLVPQHQPHDRIHTAIYMLLTSLGEVEDALCLPPQVRHASVLHGMSDSDTFPSEQREDATTVMNWGTLPTIGGIRCILADLGRKVKETKGMLRQHMNL
jgi:hypothetical protein